MPDGSNRDRFLTSVHGPDFAGDIPHQLTCQHCHGGAADFSFETMEQAHVGMVPDPSRPGMPVGCLNCHEAGFTDSACEACHSEIAAATENSLHTNLWGYKTAIEARCDCEFAAQGQGVQDGFEVNCAGCHTTCGQCHVSRPNSVGGGFPRIGTYYAHRFNRTPDMNEQCTACHGSRVGVDYKGELEGNVPDLHRSAGMKCEACHDAEEIHGDDQFAGDHYDSRYEVATMPRCEECHDAIEANFGHIHHTGLEADCSQCHAFENHPATGNCSGCHNGGIAFAFEYPLPQAQCQTCHSQPYKNCTNCHNLDESDTGGSMYEIDPSVIQLKIARNPNPDRDEYAIALVRHVPVSDETFANWGLDLPDYLDVPTWKYTSPHNILRQTPQTTVEAGESCFAACHNSPDGPNGFLLRESDLRDAGGAALPDYEANIDYVIPESFPRQ